MLGWKRDTDRVERRPMNTHLKNALKKLPGVRRLLGQRNQLLSERDRLLADLVSLRRSWDGVNRELTATRELLYSTFAGFDYRLADMKKEFAELKQEMDTELTVLAASHNTLRAEALQARNRSEELQAKLALLQDNRDKLAADFAQLQENWEDSRTQLSAVRQHRDELHTELSELKRNLPWAPPGHFYSPIPSLDEVRKDEQALFGSAPREVAGIDLREAQQLQLLHELVPYYREMPFQPGRQDGLRYYFDNPTYSYSDAILLHGMIRHLRPRRIVEIGSGFSSCMMLDTNDLFFDGSIALTFIEPYPDLLMSVIRDSDKMSVRRIEQRLQDVVIDEFQELRENDILFVDSTHVSKIGSDVNRIFFDILPALAPGVHVHFHDIFYPFEYPKTWVYEGRAWNEAYLLRVFLQYNDKFRVVLMNDFLRRFYAPFFEQQMPLALRNTGASIWLRRQ